MGLDASVRCRCFEEGKLKPGPVPIGDLYIDGDGYLASKKLDDAHERFSYRQFLARYGGLDEAFDSWLESPCEHDWGEICSERVGNWSGCAMFNEYCEEIGEEKLPILSHILPDGNGGTFPAEKAEAALKELDYFDAWLDEKMEANPTSILVDAAKGEEAWSPEDGEMKILAGRNSEAVLEDGVFRIVSDEENGAGEVLFASRHFAYERRGGSVQDGEGKSYTLTDLDSGNRIDCESGFDFCEEQATEFTVGSRKAWPWTFANVSLRKLLNASLETGNPIRWS